MTLQRPQSRTRPRWLAPALVLLALAAPAPAGAAPTTVELTDGSTFAHWAHPQFQAPIRRGPSAGAAIADRTRFLTEDGHPEVYPVLRRTVDSSANTWYRVGIPGRPNGRTGWVRDYVLGPTYGVTTRLVVDLARRRATLYRSGKAVWSSPVGVGAPGTPTPAGAGWIREKFPVRPGGGPYGPFAFGTSTYSVLTDWPGGGVIGFHGTDRPELIPGRPSHGCVRVPNAAIGRLYALMPIGTPFVVR